MSEQESKKIGREIAKKIGTEYQVNTSEETVTLVNEPTAKAYGSQDKKKDVIILDKHEKIWKIFSIVTVVVSLWTTYTLTEFTKWASDNVKDFASPKEMAYVFTLSIFIYFFRCGFRMLFYKPIYDGLEGKYFGEEREQRAKKVVKWIHDTIYYSSSVAFFYYNYRKTIVPPHLLGEADTNSYWDHMPNVPSAEKYPYLREFYIVQMAAHFCTLVEQVLFKRDEAKYYEYFLHHHLSFIMILNSYFQHQWPMGSVVMVTHDLTDIFLSSSRATEAFFKPKGNNWKANTIYGFFAFTVLVWFYSRLYVSAVVGMYGSTIVIGTLGGVWHLIGIAFTFSVSLLYILYILDLYWGMTMLKILVTAICKKEYKNTYDPKILKKKER